MYIVNHAIQQMSTSLFEQLETVLGGDVLVYSGDIDFPSTSLVRDALEGLSAESSNSTLYILLTTYGGSIEAVERLSAITRAKYKVVNFIIPNLAMSAGTIWAMTGNGIFMDYFSSLGPIDPQVHNGSKWVPATGYLIKIAQLLERDRRQDLTGVEFSWLQGIDLAELVRYEKAKELSEEILRNGLVKYKFADWSIHRSDAIKKGQPVTYSDKVERAQEIASKLSNYGRWLTHGRLLGIDVLRQELRLEIEDMSQNSELASAVKLLYDFTTQVITQNNLSVFIKTRLPNT